MSGNTNKLEFGVANIPLPIYTYLRKLSDNTAPLITWNIKIGDWVQKGQIIAVCNVKDFKKKRNFFWSKKYEATIKSPFDGIVTFINNREFCEYPDYKDWNEFMDNSNNLNGKHYESLDYLFKIRPTGEYLETIEFTKLYKVYENLTKYVATTSKEVYPNRGNRELSPKNILFYAEMLCYSKVINATNE